MTGKKAARRKPSGKTYSWTHELEEALITKWEANEFLYNADLMDYTNTPKRLAKTAEIAAELDVPVDEIRKHLHSLRSQYGRTRNKLLARKSEMAPMRLSARTKFIVARLGFLQAHMKQNERMPGLLTSFKEEPYSPEDMTYPPYKLDEDDTESLSGSGEDISSTQMLDEQMPHDESPSHMFIKGLSLSKQTPVPYIPIGEIDEIHGPTLGTINDASFPTTSTSTSSTTPPPSTDKLRLPITSVSSLGEGFNPRKRANSLKNSNLGSANKRSKASYGEDYDAPTWDEGSDNPDDDIPDPHYIAPTQNGNRSAAEEDYPIGDSLRKRLKILTPLTTTLNEMLVQDMDEESLWGKLAASKLRRIDDITTKYEVMSQVDRIINNAIAGKSSATQGLSDPQSSDSPQAPCNNHEDQEKSSATQP